MAAAAGWPRSAPLHSLKAAAVPDRQRSFKPSPLQYPRQPGKDQQSAQHPVLMAHTLKALGGTDCHNAGLKNICILSVTIPTTAAASIPQEDEAGPIGSDTYLDGERQTRGCNERSSVRAACGNATWQV